MEVSFLFSPIDKHAKEDGYSFRQFYTLVNPFFKMFAEVLRINQKRNRAGTTVFFL